MHFCSDHKHRYVADSFVQVCTHSSSWFAVSIARLGYHIITDDFCPLLGDTRSRFPVFETFQNLRPSQELPLIYRLPVLRKDSITHFAKRIADQNQIEKLSATSKGVGGTRWHVNFLWSFLSGRSSSWSSITV